MSEPCNHPLHRRGWRIALLAYAFAVIYSGFSWPLGHGDKAIFPFYRAWFMFHNEDGWYYHLTLEALREDGQREPVDMDRWFEWNASEASKRYDEIKRTPENLRALLRYVCTQQNRTAPPGHGYVQITLIDNVWRQTRGRRVPFSEVPRSQQRGTIYLRDTPCPPDTRTGRTP